MDQETAKRMAAEKALEELPDQGVIGLGSGSTARYFIAALAKQVHAGKRLVGVPTSEASRQLAEQLGIVLLPDSGPWEIDVCVDGADEVSEALDVIKGGGAAHTREKIVNQCARTNVVIVDGSKLSRRLGEKRAVPVEVLKYAHLTTARALAEYGRVELRSKAGSPVLTDSGNHLYDVETGPLEDPAAVERSLCCLPGVVDVGLFCARIDKVIIADQAGISVRTR